MIEAVYIGFQILTSIFSIGQSQLERDRQAAFQRTQNTKSRAITKLSNIRQQLQVERAARAGIAQVATAQAGLGGGITSSIAAGAKSSMLAQAAGERSALSTVAKIEQAANTATDLTELKRKLELHEKKSWYSARSRSRVDELNKQIADIQGTTAPSPAFTGGQVKSGTPLPWDNNNV